jgi:hypothetical protein
MPGNVGLSFAEVMRGGFAIHATDPSAGEQLGNAQGTTLVMRATIVINDLELFLQDPQHKGDLSGTVDFPLLGSSLHSTGGVFKLFSPGTLGEKWMVYELAFSANNKPYYLAGKKIIPQRSGTGLLPETTTLYTVLHDGSDTTGKVVGAGTLHLGVTELADLLKTIRTSNTDNFESMQAVAKFFKFFLGELWHSESFWPRTSSS